MDTEVHYYRCHVPFADTDASGRVHFSNTLRYVECAEHEFLKKLGLSVIETDGTGWPRVHVNCDYKLPLRAMDHICVKIHLAHLGDRSLKWCYEIMNPQGELAASGHIVTVKANARGELICLSDRERVALETIL